jgi:predicted Zn-dependent peptidase
MNKRVFEQIGETLYTEKLPNGLTIQVVPKKGYNKRHAMFATNYGGADRRFCLSGRWIDTPAGVAHFLEHKMFDMEDGNALTAMSASGASANAFTSTGMTAYYFDCTQRFQENLKTLLHFVSTPYFTAESVAKEQGIIGQEIRMTEDMPDYAVYYNLLKSLYTENPLRESIVGTVESIAEITAQTLYDCHKVFYNPSNMVLCVVGDEDPERIVELAREILPAQPGEVPLRDYGREESAYPSSRYVEVEMEVSAPQFIFGARVDGVAQHGAERLRQMVTGELALGCLLGNSSVFFTDLYTQGLLNYDFEAQLDYAAGSATIMAGGESRDPQRVLAAFETQLADVARNGLDPALFERVRRTAYGWKIRGLGYFGGLCQSMAEAAFAGFCPQDGLALREQITPEEAGQFLLEHLNPEHVAMSVVNPVQRQD